MKILAIRGSNIASLAGPFEVDFEKPPLSGAGLFAITGPTGAGKSTLLDVLCLALFGETPRGQGAGNLKIPVAGAGEKAQLLTAKDARNLLRRGAAEGFAEAAFAGTDGRRYRARWDVRRARGRATGTVQDAGRSLWRTDGDESMVAEGATDVAAGVERALGLTFEQFRKAVLLAQGDFAAFLRANEKERADLLEKITGAGIYSEVSKKAFERGRAVDRELDELGRRIDGLVPMDDEARRLRGEEAARLVEAARALDERLRLLDEASAKAADAARRDAEARGAGDRLRAAAGERDERRKESELLEEGLKEAQSALERVRGERESEKPRLDRAREMDVQVEAKRVEAERSASEREGARRAHRETAAEAERLAAELGKAR